MNGERFGKCVIFTHFNPEKKGKLFLDIEVRNLQEKWKERFILYNRCSEVVEHVFVFISEGYHSLLSVGAEAPFISMRNDRILINLIEKTAKEALCPENFIVPIGFDKMVDVLSGLQNRTGNSREDTNFRYLLLGDGKYMRYDSPKIVDAILRIAGRRTYPVFRLDEDVEPNKESLQRLLDAYKNLPDNQPLAFFAFSGGYGGWDFNNNRQEALLNNYAVRTSHLAKKIGDEWFVYPNDCNSFLNGLSEIGAIQGFSDDNSGGNNKNAQVISGAGFCLSYAAIKKLPPFANISSPITWIDDHLKRKMHEGLNDLGKNAGTSRVLNVLFKQNRHPEGLKYSNMEAEKVIAYLCTLARGCIFDALIHSNGNAGLYTKSIEEYCRGGDLPRIFEGASESLTQLGLELVDVGNDRLELIRNHWKKELSGQTLHLKNGREFIPSKDLIEKYLILPTLNNNIIVNAKNCLVYEVLQCAEQYLRLLKIWPEFTSLLEGITDDNNNNWLFK